jgi:hypothetical protein
MAAKRPFLLGPLYKNDPLILSYNTGVVYTDSRENKRAFGSLTLPLSEFITYIFSPERELEGEVGTDIFGRFRV